MKISERGIAALIAHEGIAPAPYWDTAKPPVLTWGIGHTAAAGAPIPANLPRGMPTDLDATLREVFAVFRRDLARYEADVARAIGRTPCAQHEFDAAVSFHFNTGAIARAAWVDLWKSGRRTDAARSMLVNWRRPASIIERREAEQALFLSGDYGKGRAAVWNVSVAGNVGRLLRTLGQEEILTLMLADELLHPKLQRGDVSQLVSKAQALLRAAGHDPGPIDGKYGAKTHTAALALQSARGIPATGQIDAATWAALLKGQ